MSNSWDRVQEERKKLVQQIIDNMKKGYVLPKPGWDEGAFAIGRINNPVSHARYRGINLVRLYIDQMANGYKDGRYMTYKQAQSQGWQVKKGAVGIRLEKYLFDKVVEEKNEETGEIEKKRVRLRTPIVNQFVVFHASQIECIPELEEKELEPLQPDEMIEIAEQFIKTSECPIVETGEGRAYYSPGQDEIHLPYRDAFLDTQSFLATQLHEMIHSTGHPGRLNRNLNGVFGSESYAREELRAELGSFFIQTDLGLNFDAQHFNSHTQYLESWISALEDQPDELFRAISDAQKASDYLEERYEREKEIGEEYIAEKEIKFPVKGWTRNSDGSGSLIAADGTEIASYDLSTSELNVKLPFTEDKLYENYTDSECSFEIVRDRAVRWINYKVLDNLEREATVIAEGYREDENNYYRIIRNENLENPITVEKVTYGQCGFGKQCKNAEEVKEFIETFTQSTERRAVVCVNWSEADVFEKGKIYSMGEFDSLMKQADTEWVEKRQQELEAYNHDEEAVWDAYDRNEIDGIHLGYEKTDFTIYMPDGSTIHERQDIGDGYGGVIDYLNTIPGYEKQAIELRKSVHGEQDASLTERELATVRMAVKRERKREGAGEQHIKAWLDRREQEYKELGISFHRERGCVMMQVYNRMKNEPVEHKDMKKAACR